MSEAWEPLSDDDDDKSLSDQELEYDMWEGQFDLFAIDHTIDNFAERFSLDFTIPYFILICTKIRDINIISHSNCNCQLYLRNI